MKMRNHFLILRKKEEGFVLTPIEKIVRVDKIYQNKTKISVMDHLGKNEDNNFLNLNIK
jgi:hypothetical protein